MWYRYVAILACISYAISSAEQLPGSGRAQRPSYLIPDLAANCFIGDTIHPDAPQEAYTPYLTVGYETAQCEGDLCGKPICCPPEIAREIDLHDCTWRGSASDCHGQCATGQVKLAHSTWDEPPASESPMSSCKRGSKALCCGLISYEKMVTECYRSPGFGYPCTHDYTSIAHFWNPWVPWKKGRPVYNPGEDICCPMSSPLPFVDCHWVGGGDCVDATCAAGEVSLGADGVGGDGESCIGAGLKSLCCRPNLAALDGMVCGVDDFCLEDPYGCEDDEVDEDWFGG
ncbi:hypothetical protein P170DRAFT_439854 [Aspergillus steynii IBT 23096]|uniref:Uncharacterized protein n=1 Tax=Aspergillus steynii IBT 23096 TaxID=1392250 RepID=A0A2I2FZY8_9EURO|nr:uncharacterized protein P170DRAFT_439854 [Aspergillus steynii IBT 23096]PLB46191.1 hypothetical protein P170DRAFT_439854 [Aspergillus steynii IBT 23096]